MGCEFSPEEQPDSPYNQCRITITNLHSKPIAVFPLKQPQIRACTEKHFIVLNLEEKIDEVACPFSSEITCAIQINNPELKIIAGKESGEITILHFRKKTEKYLLGHSSKITFLHMLRNGQLCSGSSDGDVFIWDLTTKMDELNFSASNEAITCLCELKDGGLVVVSKEDTGKLFNIKLQTIEIIWDIHGANYLIQIKDGRLVFGSDGDIIVSKVEKLFDVSKYGKKDRKYSKTHQPDFVIQKAHEGMISMFIQLKSGDIASAGNDGLIKIWSIKNEFICIKELEGHNSRINYLSEIPNYRLLSCSDDGWVKLWSK